MNTQHLTYRARRSIYDLCYRPRRQRTNPRNDFCLNATKQFGWQRRYFNIKGRYKTLTQSVK